MLNIGIDLGGTNVRVATVDANGQIVELFKEKTEAEKGYKYVIDKMIRMIHQLKDFDQVQAIGVGSPGSLSAKQGLILSPTNLKDWVDVPLQQILEDATNLPVAIDNDANVAGLGEALFGIGKGKTIVQYITISTGVGGGLVINDRIVTGLHNCASEIGNIVLEPGGHKHSHMTPGSFEAVASGENLLRLGKIAALPVTQTSDLFELYRANDAKAIELIKTYAHRIAQGLGTIAMVVDPDIFILGGGVMQESDILLPLIKQAYPHYVYQEMDKTEIVLATLDEPGIVGAAFLPNAKRI